MLALPVILAMLLPSGFAQSVAFERRPTQNYPTMDVHGPAPLQAWIDTYNLAKSKGLIPSLVPATLPTGGVPTYPAGTTLGAGGACSWTLTHCFGAYDVVAAPTGIVGLTFDDGPQLASPVLYDFLKSQNQTATHFLIGSRALNFPDILGQAFRNGEHLAGHTWSHPYMTTMNDMQVLGELGWASQVIYDQTGLVPAFWRPPYGDVDDRVRAIAKHVFDMYTVLWNQDTFDWSLIEGGGSVLVGAGPQTDAGLDATLQNFYRGPKSPGLIILEHEVTSRSVGGFTRNFATLKSQNWNASNIPSIWGVPWYLNADTTSSGVKSNTTVGYGSSATRLQFTNSSNVAIPSPTAAANRTSATVVIVTPTNTAVTVTASIRSVTSSSASSTSPPAVQSSARVASAHIGVVAPGALAILALAVGIVL